MNYNFFISNMGNYMLEIIVQHFLPLTSQKKCYEIYNSAFTSTVFPYKYELIIFNWNINISEIVKCLNSKPTQYLGHLVLQKFLLMCTATGSISIETGR